MIKIVEKQTTDLIPYENNARINDDAVEFVANSIKEFGFKNPIIIDNNNVIIAGHTRLKAAEKLGIKKVPCIVADDLTEEQIKAFRIADNSTAQIAEWDMDKLMAELETIDYDMSKYGLAEQMAEIEKIIDENKEVEEDDFDAELPEEPKAKLGDIYKLGNHRLMCGDSTKEEDVAKLMNGELADLVVTDPPYNVEYDGNKNPNTQNDFNCGENRKIQNDKMQDGVFYNFLIKAFSNMNENIKDGGSFYIWHADSEGANFRNACNEVGWKVRQCLIWVKNRIMMGRQDYQWKHEPCLYGWKDGAGHYFIDDRTETTVIEDNGIDLKKLKKEEMLKLLQDIYSDKISTSIIHEDRPSRSDLHPTMKPIKLLARLIKNSSRKEESVLDLFGGSGSSLIACEQLNRHCYMMELDPKYCDVIIKRWENLTGKKAIKL